MHTHLSKVSLAIQKKFRSNAPRFHPTHYACMLEKIQSGKRITTIYIVQCR